MGLVKRKRRLAIGFAVVLGAAASGRPQAPPATTVTVTPPAVAVAPGEASAAIVLEVTLAAPSRGGDSFAFGFELPAALGTSVLPEPSRIVVAVPGGQRKGSARFRLRVEASAPAGTHRIGLRETRGRGSAHVDLTVVGPPVPPGRPPAGGSGGGRVRLEVQPASIRLCDGGDPVSIEAALAPEGGYRGRPHLRFRPLPAGITVLPPAADPPPLPPTQAASFRVSARGAPGRHLLALEAHEAGRGVLATAGLTVEVTTADFGPSVVPPAPVLHQGGAAAPVSLGIQPGRCFAAPAVSLSIAGAPPGLTVTPAAATLAGPGFAPAPLQLRASSAVAPGEYRLVATLAGGGVSRRVEIPVRVEPPGLAGRLRAPRIDEVRPARATPGQHYRFELRGQNFDARMTLSLGDGIQLLGPPLVESPTRATVEALVAPGAAPGVRTAVARGATGETKGPGGVLVETLPAPAETGPAPQPGPAVGVLTPPLAPRVDDVQPAVLERGKAYLLKLTGENLASAREYGFGPGIAVAAGSLTPLSPTQAVVKVQVAANAPGGRRWAVAYGGAGSAQGPGSVAVLLPTPPPPVLQPAPPPKPKPTILLDAPRSVTYPKGIDPGAPKEYLVPRLDDEVKLEWHEQNPGVAQSFELRFLDASGEKALLSRRIDPVVVPAKGKTFSWLPTFFRPSAALVAELSALVPKPSAPARQPLPPGGAGSAPSGSAPGSSPALAKGRRDLLWEVRGYAGGTGGATSGGTPQGMLVEVSERWPLAFAGRPTGLTCPAGGAASGTFTLQNKNGTGSAAVHVGDAVSLTGSFDFGLSPYALHPVGIKTPIEEALEKIGQAKQQLDKANPLEKGGGAGSGSKLATWSRWKFDTVFVDWGDGTVEPLVADAAAAGLAFHSGLPLHLPSETRKTCGPGAPYLHCYESPGSYTVRLYQLPNDAAQKASPTAAGGAPGGAAAGGAKVVLAALGQPVGVAGSELVVAGQAGDLAYMLFCRDVTVLPKPDLCAEGPLQLAKIEVVGFPGHEAPAGQGGSSSPGPAPLGAASTCDTFLSAQARLHYVGKGQARVRWRYEDGTILKEEVLALQSPPASGSAQKGGGASLATRDDLFSPVLPVSELGVHGLSVEAEVLHDPLGAILQAAEAGTTQAYCSITSWSSLDTLDHICKKEPLFCPGAPAATAPSAGSLEVGLVVQGALAGAAGLGAGGVQPLGVIKPGGAAGAAGGATALDLEPKPSGKKEPPEFVTSHKVHYKVLSPDPTKPCFFLFPTQKGDFIVADVNLQVTPSGPGAWSGSGVLKLPLTQGDAVEYFPVKTNIAQWAAPDGVHVTQGQIKEAPGLAVKAPASEAKLTQLVGTAGGLLEPRLSVSPLSKLLVDPQAQGPPRWTAQAPLSSQGDWLASGLATPRLAVGHSAFEFAPWTDVTLDFSRTEGKAPGSAACGGAGAAWTGIHLGKAPLSIYQFEVQKAGQSPLRDLEGWVVEGQGLCGQATVAGLPKLPLGDGGWIQSGALQVQAGGGAFSATFQGLQVFSPWFSQPGSQPLGPVDAVFYDSAGPDQKYFKIPGLGSPAAQDWGSVTLAAKDLELQRVAGLGWAIRGDFAFALRDHAKKPFASFATSSVAIELSSGHARLGGGQAQESIPLAGAAGPAPHLGDTPLLLKAVNVGAQASGDRRLAFDFDAMLKLSQANHVLPDAPAHVLFEVRRQGAGMAAPVPSTPAFALTASFPAGKSPTSEAAMSLQYVPGSTFYCGQLDLALLGGKGLGAGKGTFVLGYDGAGKDGWLAHYEVPLAGGAGVPIAPPLPINLFSIDGGLGFNIDEKAFSNPLTCKTPFQIAPTGVVFSAGLRAGTSDRTTLTLDGQLTIDPGTATRFDVDAWLLDGNPSGKGDIEGVLKWADGAFRGTFWGGYSFLEDPTGLFGGHAVELSLGSSQANAAVDLLVSKSGEWHVWAGKNPKNKSGSPISGRVLWAKNDVWLMVGGQGLSGLDLDVGGRQKLEVGGCVWECCASAYAEFGCGLEMSASPPKVKGSAHAEFGVKLCGLGFSLGGNASLGCCPPTAHVELCAEIKPCADWDGLCDACAGFGL